MTLLRRWLRKLGLAAAPAPDPRPARRDELTALASRAPMHDALVAALHARTAGAAVMVDVDHFKYLNDRHGHAAGDELLRAVARRLLEALPAAGLLARVGGDRFMAWLPGHALPAARQAAQACVDAMREPVAVAGGTEIVTVSAGVATLEAQAGRAVDAVWQACEAALHAAKARGRDRVVAFDDDTRRRAAARRDPASATQALQQRHRALREEARTDPLTGLRNRLALDELLNAAAAPEAAGRLQHAAVAVVDVDHFGDYDHVHGDAAGDDALRAVARAIRASARAADFVFRKGGEEFVVVFPDIDGDADAPVAAAERIRAAVQDLALPHAAPASAGIVTVTIGVAGGPPGATLRQLLEAAAEKAMAGKVGEQRNRVHAVRLPGLPPA